MARDPSSYGRAAIPVHPAKTPEKTDDALKGFKNAGIAAIAATDVLAMGVDVPDVSLVVHCGLPDSQRSYVQKTGRAGERAGMQHWVWI